MFSYQTKPRKTGVFYLLVCLAVGRAGSPDCRQVGIPRALGVAEVHPATVGALGTGGGEGAVDEEPPRGVLCDVRLKQAFLKQKVGCNTVQPLLAAKGCEQVRPLVQVVEPALPAGLIPANVVDPVVLTSLSRCSVMRLPSLVMLDHMHQPPTL